MDSRDNAKILNKSQAEGFCDDFVGCQAVGEGIYLSGNEQAHRADSRKSAQKANTTLKKEMKKWELSLPLSPICFIC